MLNSSTDNSGSTKRKSFLTIKLKSVSNMISALRVDALSFHIRLCCS